MDHLEIPTTDYVYAPSKEKIDKALDFIHSKYVKALPWLCIIVQTCMELKQPELIYILFFLLQKMQQKVVVLWSTARQEGHEALP